MVGLTHLRRAVALLGFWGLLLCAPLPAQDQPQTQRPSCPEQCPYSIAGVVLNSATHAPIPRTLVQADGPVKTATMTDDNGRFQLDGLPAAQFSVSAVRPGFVVDQGRRFPGGVRARYVEVGGNTPFVTLKLVPQAVIQGTVTDADGLPIENARVEILTLTNIAGHSRWLDTGFPNTDEKGQFRAVNLAAGKYCVVALVQTEIGLAPPGRVSRSEEAWGYPSVYFPCAGGTTTSALELKPGQQVQVDLQMHLSRFFTVSGTIGDRARQESPTELHLVSRSPAGPAHNVTVEPDGKFHSEPVPAGDYVLRGATYGEKQLQVQRPVTLIENVTGLRLSLQPVINIPIVVQADPLPPEAEGQNLSNASRRQRPLASINLLSDEGSLHGGAGALASEAGSALSSVMPGSYTVMIQPTEPQFYVASAWHGTTDLLRDDLVVAPGADRQPIYIVLRSGCARIGGTVRGDFGSDTAVLAVPDDGERAHYEFAQPKPSGGFEFRCVAPGAYTLITLADAADAREIVGNTTLDLSHGVHVTAAAGQESSATLTVEPQGDD